MFIAIPVVFLRRAGFVETGQCPVSFKIHLYRIRRQGVALPSYKFTYTGCRDRALPCLYILFD
jgi:hypothetical protein